MKTMHKKLLLSTLAAAGMAVISHNALAYDAPANIADYHETRTLNAVGTYTVTGVTDVVNISANAVGNVQVTQTPGVREMVSFTVRGTAPESGNITEITKVKITNSTAQDITDSLVPYVQLDADAGHRVAVNKGGTLPELSMWGTGNNTYRVIKTSDDTLPLGQYTVSIDAKVYSK